MAASTEEIATPSQASTSRAVHFNEAELSRGVQKSFIITDQELPLQPLDFVLAELPEEKVGEIENTFLEVKKIVQECVAALGIDAPDIKLYPIGAYALGMLLADEEVDAVISLPCNVSLNLLLESLRDAIWLGKTGTEIVSASPDGLFAAPGLRCRFQGAAASEGLRLKLLLAHDIQLPEQRPEALVQSTTGLLARQVSEKLLELVPNQEIFRSLLRFIRCWAKQHGIYGSHAGYLGGQAWAILCAYVCQQNPSIEISELIATFFHSLHCYNWSTPLQLQPSQADPQPAYQAAGPMQTLTIVLPVGMNLLASSQLTDTTKRITLKELRKGRKAVEEVEQSRADWSSVALKEGWFFQRHKHYLELDFMATNAEVQAQWLNWGMDQIHGLILLFESMMGNKVTLRPWPDPMEFRDSEWPKAQAMFIGLHLEGRDRDAPDQESSRTFDLREIIVKFFETLTNWPKAQTYALQFELVIRHIRHADLERWFDEQRNGLVVTRNYDTSNLQ